MSRRCAFAIFIFVMSAFATAATGKPTQLQCDSLATPLGVDDPQPLFSWQLHDDRYGAKQTAYEIQVASRSALLSTKPDVWDSGRVQSDQSVGVTYGGPALQPSKRYFWRVKVWDKDGNSYPDSDVSWWETGLLDSKNWRAKWIGYEEEGHRALREANAAWVSNPGIDDYKDSGDTHHNFRYTFNAPSNLKRADLFVTGEDTAAVWINSQAVLEAKPLPPWNQSPWKTYSKIDVTSALHSGNNSLAIDVIHYARKNAPPNANNSRAPMSATLCLQLSDGSFQTFKTGDPGWKAALNASGDWFGSEFNDGSWAEAVPYVPPQGRSGSAELGHPWPTEPVKYLRRTFEVQKPIRSARLYATALGAYEFHLNGKGVGDQILAPGWMDFREHVAYQAYDVSDQLKSGQNAIAAYLAPGWYATPLQWYRQGYNYGDTPEAVKAQLRIEYSDGSVDWIVTDESWKADISPIMFAEIYDGEIYDARRVQTGWDTASFSDSRWRAVQIIAPREPEIVWQYFQPIRGETAVSAKSVTSPKPGVYVFDFGQNLSGVPRIRVQGPAGTDVQLRFAEVLNPDGTLYVENLRTAKATDHFILAGTGVEEYQPHFTFHGFRYAELSGVSSKPAGDAIQAVVIHTDAPFTAELRTSSDMLNKLWSNILWGQRSNFVGVPTDCPQRDERLGWSADAQVFWRTAFYNMNLTEFSKKYAADLRGTQIGTPMYGIFAPGTLTPNPGHGTGWSDAGVIIPWTGWIQYGDKRTIEQNWDAMEKYLSAIQADNPDFLWKKNYGIAFGDWLSPEGPTPEDLIATAYWAYDVTLMREMAHAAAKSADEQRYAALFEKIKDAFNKAYVRPDGFVGGVPPPPVFASGAATKLSDKPIDTQTSYVLALYMNLLPNQLRSVSAKRLVDKIAGNGWRLSTGFLGTPYLLEVLADNGHVDVAYRLLLNTEYPSWGYLVEHGATTMWERWNGDQMRGDPSMNSYNHYAYGAVAEWIYRYAAGIDTSPLDPGFHTIVLRPTFDSRLNNLAFSYESPYGKIQSGWSRSGTKTSWRLIIPPNSRAWLLVSGEQAKAISLDGEPLTRNAKAHRREDQVGAGYELAAGTYSFSIN
ncbi:MAG TPA: family 78 glycoside hydrolase catalytic domain [Terriglobales bacterium]|nr:family 78 glycoside hydrolase catalytic domain [Terriglobales bacterium]